MAAIARKKASSLAALDGKDIDLAIELAATRHRLLDAAGAVFAEVGYERAGVREICLRARANIAAVNYHFGGKYPLYEAAIGYWLERESRERTGDLETQASGDQAEARLRAFILMFVGRLLDHRKPAWHARLVAREMAEPTGVIDAMVARTIRPMLRRLRAIVLEIVGTKCPRESLERAVLSVMSQCIFYVHARPVLERVFPAHVHEPDINAIASHIADFSIAGLRALSAKPIRKKQRGRA